MTSPRTSHSNRHACARTIVTLQQQDGGYALLWKHYDNNNMAATLYCCCCRCILHLQQYSRRLNLFFFYYTYHRGSTQWRISLRHCATTRKVAGSILCVIEIFLNNLSDRSMDLGSTQPLTETSTRNISWR